jgi:hypothetical protein
MPALERVNVGLVRISLSVLLLILDVDVCRIGFVSFAAFDGGAGRHHGVIDGRHDVSITRKCEDGRYLWSPCGLGRFRKKKAPQAFIMKRPATG